MSDALCRQSVGGSLGDWMKNQDKFNILDDREQFYKVSNSIYNFGLDVYQIGVYGVLCRYADNKTKECFPSATQISKVLTISRQQVFRALLVLVEKDIINRKSGHTGKANTYTLLNLASNSQRLVTESVVPVTPRDHVVTESDPKKTYKKDLNKKTNSRKASLYNSLDEVNKKDVNIIKDKMWNFLKQLDRLPIGKSNIEKWNHSARQPIAECVLEVGGRFAFGAFVCMMNLEDYKHKKYWWDNFAHPTSLSTMINQFKSQKESVQKDYQIAYDEEIA